jgi:hypothetical protein
MAQELRFSMVSRSTRLRAIQALVTGGLICGVLDITAAFVVYGAMGVAPMRLLQGIASGLLGRSAFDGGLPAAILGLFCHFFIAFSASAIFVATSEWLRLLLRHPVVSGVMYAFVVYFFMQLVVLPLSAAQRRAFSPRLMAIGLLIHIACVGLPISLSARHFQLGSGI